MDNIKAKATETFSRLGYQGEELDTMVTNFLDDENTEFDYDSVLTKAQEYAKPFIAESIEQERKQHWQGQYTNAFIGEMVKASNGAFSRRDMEGKSAADIVSMFQAKFGTVNDSTELQNMVNALNAEKEAWEETTRSTVEQEVSKVRNEYASKEQQRVNFDNMLSTLGKKNIVKEVDRVEAANVLLAKMQGKYDLAWNASKGTFDVFEKGTQNLAKKNGTSLVEFEKELEADLKAFNWIAASNGGSGGAPPLPPNPNKVQSSLGGAFERTGRYQQ